MSLKLRLVAGEYNQLVDPKDPSKSTRRIVAGEEFEAHDQAEYERLTHVSERDKAKGRKPAAVAADAPDPDDPASLKGADLDAALEFYGLATDGKAGEKRERIAAHLEANPDVPRYEPAG